MFTPHDFRILWKQVQPYRAYIPSLPVLSAGGIAILGAGLLLALPDASNESATASAAVDQTASAESACDKQAWPYIDQRCAQRVEAARATRQVRVVTDRGTAVTMVTPMPIVEPKPAPPKPVVAQAARPIGPVAAPAPAPKVGLAAAQSAPPAAANAMAMEPAKEFSKTRSASISPSPASAASVSPGVEAFDDMPSKKSKAQKKAEKREAKRETKRQKAIEQDDGSVPAEVVAAVKSLQGGRARSGVPAEVLAAVEEAVARGGERRGQVVTVGSPTGGGQRMYLVPRERGEW